MKFGVNLKGKDDFDAFIKEINNIGISRVKAFIDLNSRGIKGKADKLKKYSVYLSFMKAGLDVFHDWDKKMEKFQKVLTYFSKLDVLGVALVEDVYSITRRGTSRRGVLKEVVIISLNKMAKVIRDAGYKVVFPVRIDDIEGGFWDRVDCDIYDIDVFLKRQKHPVENLSTDRPVWFGKAGRHGGNIKKSLEENTYRSLMKAGKDNCDMVFIWVDQSNDRFSLKGKDKDKLVSCFDQR